MRAAVANARRRADRGEAEGDHALGLLAAFGPTLSRRSDDPVSDASFAEAHTHLEAAARLGDARAAQALAITVWMHDGLLASEPYYRAIYAAGNEDAASMLALIALERPALERGERGRDAPGDLSRLGIVGATDAARGRRRRPALGYCTGTATRNVAEAGGRQISASQTA